MRLIQNSKVNADWMTFKIYNYFNFYVLNILLIYTQLKKKKNKKQKTKKTKLRVKETNILKKKKFSYASSSNLKK